MQHRQVQVLRKSFCQVKGNWAYLKVEEEPINIDTAGMRGDKMGTRSSKSKEKTS